MKINALSLENVKCFRGKHEIDFSSSVNVFVGHNNTGKSTILSAIYQLQNLSIDQSFKSLDVDRGVYRDANCEIKLFLEPINERFIFKGKEIFYPYGTEKYYPKKVWISFSINRGNGNLYGYVPSNTEVPIPQLTELGVAEVFPNVSPGNLIYPILSNRKVKKFNPSVSNEIAKQVPEDLINLCAKVDRLNNSSRDYHEDFKKVCKHILGFTVSTEYATEGDGKYIALTINNEYNIPIEQLGAGVANMLGIIADIFLAKNKIFLIEEPENDLHPRALKSLLNLIYDRSEVNQFFISTHSNIVVSYLGSKEDTRIFQVKSRLSESLLPTIPNSEVVAVINHGERVNLLKDLGYEMFDYFQWEGWLFLEESSAESIIRDYLIADFAPNLKGKLGTFSSSGFDTLDEKFDYFDRLFRFTHLSPIYKDKVWVIVDEGQEESKVIDRLAARYTSWNSSHFRQFSKHDFEEYYPSNFSEGFNEIKNVEKENLSKKDKIKKKRELKKNLLLDVKKWYNENPAEAKGEFEKSAKEVIGILKEIERSLIQ